MKHLLLTLMLGLTLSCAHAEDATTVMELPWDSPYAVKVPDSEITHPDQGPAVLTVPIVFSPKYLNTYPVFKATLFRIPDPKVASNVYTLTGEVAYQNLDGRSNLYLAASYLESGVSIMGTGDQAGLAASFNGTSDFRPFAITFTGHPASDKLQQLEVNVSLTGQPLPLGAKAGDLPESVSLRNLKLVEYPAPPPPPPAPIAEAPAAPVPATPAPSPGLDWPSFWIGVTACVLVLLALAQVLLLVRRVKQTRHDKEMRRIASLDR